MESSVNLTWKKLLRLPSININSIQSWLGKIGRSAEDTKQEAKRKTLLVTLGALMSVGALMWSGAVLALGLHIQSLIPIGYIVITILNFSMLHATKRLRLVGFIQISISLILPFVMQWILGGLIASGLVMLWSPIAILGALIVQKGKGMAGWVILFVFLTLVSGLFDKQFQAMRPEVITDGLATGMLIFNVSCMVGLITGMSVLNFAKDRKIRIQLHETMHDLEASKEEIATQGEVLLQKSDLLEAQNLKIMDALRYARRIQQAVLPSVTEMENYFSDCMVMFEPRDEVSGDFYWCSELEDRLVVVGADCTGHGVSGAFLTMLGSSILNQLVNEDGIVNPAELMKALDVRLQQYLRQEKGGSHRVADGMDAAIMVFRKGSKTVEFAGAKQPLWVVRNGELKELKGDRYPVGDNTRYSDKAWTTRSYTLQSNDRIFFSTDGFKDQFGGEGGTKYMSKRLKQFLIDAGETPMTNLKTVLHDELSTWRGDRPQIDDILVMGMQIQ